jgi:hypothetical protein
VVVVAKLGIRERSGKVRTPDGIYKIGAPQEGWYTIPAPAGEVPGRVRYTDERDLLEIERSNESVSIHFRPELEHTTFELNGRTYEVGTLDFGSILIKEGGRAVVRGHGTVSGVRLLDISPDLESWERELAFGLALRAAGLDRLLWKEDHPLPPPPRSF